MEDNAWAQAEAGDELVGDTGIWKVGGHPGTLGVSRCSPTPRIHKLLMKALCILSHRSETSAKDKRSSLSRYSSLRTTRGSPGEEPLLSVLKCSTHFRSESVHRAACSSGLIAGSAEPQACGARTVKRSAWASASGRLGSKTSSVTS